MHYTTINKKIQIIMRKKTTEEVVKEFKDIHGDKYIYDKVEYDGATKKVCIICPIHGEFWQTPHTHLSGCGCKKCAIEKNANKYKSDTTDFINKSKKVHGDNYIYDKTEYKGAFVKVCITCLTHGDFYQAPTKHLSGCGCSKCNGGVSINQEEFIAKAKDIHKDKYDYSKTKYINYFTKVCITCPIHGDFWQIPSNHIHKTKPEGCPKCASSKMESEIRHFLLENNISFEEQKHFKWLGKQSLDFYLPSKNIGIECQGRQHFESIDHFGGDDGLKTILERDERKYNLCTKNNVDIIYYIHKENEKDIFNKNYIINKKQLLDIL